MAKSLKGWKRDAWKELSKYKRSLGYCMMCGRPYEPRQLDAHHIITKAHGNYAYFEEDNIVPLCKRYCHRWWHGNATWDEQKAWVEQWIGLERYWEIKRDANKTCKYGISDYEDMIDRWKVMQE